MSTKKGTDEWIEGFVFENKQKLFSSPEIAASEKMELDTDGLFTAALLHDADTLNFFGTRGIIRIIFSRLKKRKSASSGNERYLQDAGEGGFRWEGAVIPAGKIL